MVNDMMAAQHNCKGLLKFIFLDDTVTVNVEVMTLTGLHVFKQDKIVVRKVLFHGARRTHLLQHF